VNENPVVKPPLNPDIHIEADVPARGEEGHVEKIAEVFQAGLEAASASTTIRLKMILGEAYQKYTDIAFWLAQELAKDEAKAPGLIAAAQQYAKNPALLKSNYAPVHRDIVRVQQDLLEEAIDSGYYGVAIEDKSCSDPADDT
jgi:hypothetical protein